MNCIQKSSEGNPKDPEIMQSLILSKEALTVVGLCCMAGFQAFIWSLFLRIRTRCHTLHVIFLICYKLGKALKVYSLLC